MKRIISLVLVLLLALSLSACKIENAVLDEIKDFEVTEEVHSLNVKISAADFKIEHGSDFLVKSNLKYLSVSVVDGVLCVVDNASGGSTFINAQLTLYLPEGVMLDSAIINTGAAKMTAQSLSAKNLKLSLGAGDVRINSLTATQRVEINGGAGEITIVDSTLNDLKLEMGMGELNLTGALSGDSELELGVGEANISLLGAKDDYKVDIEKGLGSLTVDGKVVTDFGSSGDGPNFVEIDGGVGAINLSFRDK